MVGGVFLRNSSIMSQNQSFILPLYIFVMNPELLGWANGLDLPIGHKLAHSLIHFASGLPICLNNNGLGCPFA